MNSYVKVMTTVSLFIIMVLGIGFVYSVNKSATVIQHSLDKKTEDAASLIALSLNDVDIESEIELVESLIRGAYTLGSFDEVTLYGRPQGENQNLKLQNKKDMAKDVLKNSFFELKASESLVNITLDGELQGKVLVRGDIKQAFIALNDAVNAVLRLYIILILGSIVIVGIVLKMLMFSKK